MKAAIVTLHRVYNYGSALQAYATQRVFEQAGYEAGIIDYITPQRTLRRLLTGVPDDSMSGVKLLAYRCAKSVSIRSLSGSSNTFISASPLLSSFDINTGIRNSDLSGF